MRRYWFYVKNDFRNFNQIFMSVICKCSADYAKAEDFLQNRFEKCKTISGTQSFHYVEPNANYKLKIQVFSSRNT